MRITNTFRRMFITAVAAAFGLGLIAIAGGAATDAYAKRDDDMPEVTLVGDDDDGDSDDDTLDSGTGDSNDATNSVVTRATRDNDISRDDLTRDLTNDGPFKRDWSDNRTNDASRNDSRASRKTGDMTRSNYSRVSWDRDASRGDLTKEFTRDGGDRTRDFSRNLSGDNSRNDTR